MRLKERRDQDKEKEEEQGEGDRLLPSMKMSVFVMVPSLFKHSKGFNQVGVAAAFSEVVVE